jgi:chitodextrinase
LQVTGVTDKTVSLSWLPSTDGGGSGIGGYTIWRSATQGGIYSRLASSGSTTFTDQGLTYNTSWWYKVSAFDNRGNESGLSDNANGITTADVTAPTAPTNLIAFNPTANSISLSWTASSDPLGSGVASYNVYRSLTQGGTYSLVGTSLIPSFTNTGLLVSTTYWYKVEAVDVAGNISDRSSPATETTGSSAFGWNFTQSPAEVHDFGLVAPGAVLDISNLWQDTPTAEAYFTKVIQSGGAGTVTVNQSTGAPTMPVIDGTYDFTIDLVDGNAAELDWLARSTDTGVIWAHDFREDAEFTNFWDGSDTPLKSQLVTTPFGSSRAIASTAYGTSIRNTTPSASGAVRQWWDVVDASQLPDPTTPYNLLVGSEAFEGNAEEITLYARDLTPGANRIDVLRATGSHPAYGTDYRVGRGPGGIWNRPFGAFPAVSNGKATDADIGWTRQTVARRTWTHSAQAHNNFREAYYGHPTYWRDAPQTWKDWDPLDGAGGGPHIDAFDGEEFYIQYRIKISSARVAEPQAKMLYIQNSAGSTNQQIYLPIGPSRPSWTVPDDWAYGSTFGNFAYAVTCWGGSLGPSGAPMGAVLIDPTNTTYPQCDAGDYGRYQDTTAFPEAYLSAAHTSMKGFCWPTETWVTILIHVKPGRDICVADYDTVGNGPAPTAPFNPRETTFEFWVHIQGEVGYKLLMSRSDFALTYGDNKQDWGWYYYNPPAFNAVWVGQYLNDYLGSGAQYPPAQSHSVQYTQVIFSQSPIAAPTV